MSDKGFSVEEVKGGWVLDWHDRRKKDADREIVRWPSLPPAPTSGREIFTTKKALEKRIKELI